MSTPRGVVSNIPRHRPLARIFACAVAAVVLALATNIGPAGAVDWVPSSEAEAQAAAVQDVAIRSLQTDPPVYVSADSPLRLNREAQRQVAAAIEAAQVPIYVAMLPRAARPAREATERIATSVDPEGTFFVTVGTVMDVSSPVPGARSLLTRAYSDRRWENTEDVMVRFVELVADRVHGREDPDAGFPIVPVAIVAGVLVVAISTSLLLARRRSGQGE